MYGLLHKGNTSRFAFALIVFFVFMVSFVSSQPGQAMKASSSTSIVGPPPDSRLNNTRTITATLSSSSKDLWIAGSYPLCGYGSGQCYTSGPAAFFDHWDGKAWQLSYPPNSQVYGIINGLAQADRTVWAVGGYARSLGSSFYPTVLRYNGSTWQNVAIPVPNDATGFLDAIVALPSRNLYVAGKYSDTRGDHALLDHFDGVRWSKVVLDPTLTEVTKLSRIGESNSIVVYGTNGTSASMMML